MADVPYSPVPSVEPSGQGIPEVGLNVVPGAFGVGLGRELSQAGESLAAEADRQFALKVHFQQVKNETDANEAAQSYADFVTQKEVGFRSLQGSNAVDALPQFQKDLQERFNDISTNMKSPEARLAFRRDARSFYDRSMYSAGLHAGDQAKIANVAAATGKVKAIQDFTTLHYDDPQAVADGINKTIDAETNAAFSAGITDPDAVHAKVSNSVGDLLTSTIVATLSQGVTTAEQRESLTKAQALFDAYEKETIPGSPGVPMLDAAHRDRLSVTLQNKDITLTNREQAEQARADRLLEEQAVKMRFSLNKAYTNGAAMVERGFPATELPTDDQIAAAYPHDPDRAAELQDRVQDLRDISHYLNVLPGATPEQIRTLEAQVAPDPNHPETFASRVRLSNALDAALNARAKALNADPVGYLLSNHSGYNIPTYGDLQAQFNSSIKVPDARIPIPYAAASGGTAFGAYVDHVDAIQASMGVPEAARHVLPVQTAQTLAQQISSDPASARQKMQQLQSQFGDRWQRVWHDLTTLGKLPADYQLVGTLDNKEDADLLARAMVEGKNGKNVDDLLAPKLAQDIKTNVLNNPRIQQYLFSLDASGASDEQKIGIRDGILKLAYAKAFYKQDAQAAPNAVNSVVGSYDMSIQGGARIPTALASDVKARARSFLSGLNETAISVPAIYGQPGMPDKRDYLDALKAHPNWITSPQGNSLWLKDNANRIVLDKSGRPVSIPFDTTISIRLPPMPAPTSPPVVQSPQRQSSDYDTRIKLAQRAAESGTATTAISDKGAYGRYQIRPQDFPEYDKNKLLTDASYNEKARDEIFQKLLTKHHGNYGLALAEYHGGTDMKNWGPKTWEYVTSILQKAGG